LVCNLTLTWLMVWENSGTFIRRERFMSYVY
jgi:hypothetical protein